MEIQFNQSIDDQVEMNYFIFKQSPNYKKQQFYRLLILIIFPLLLSMELILKTHHKVADVLFLSIMTIFSIYSFISHKMKNKNLFRNHFKTILNMKEEMNYDYKFNEDHLISINEFTESKILYKSIDKVIFNPTNIYFFVPDGNILIFPLGKITEKENFIDFVEKISLRFQIIVDRFD